MSQTPNSADQTDKSLFGFWVYLMTDCVLFASLFAAFVVLRDSTWGGHSAGALFSANFALTETLILLTSSFICGLAILSAYRGQKQRASWLFGLTFVLGVAFLALEIREFNHLYQLGDSWRRSAFLSAFFTLVGTHGLHITAGLVWIATMLWRIRRTGLSQHNLKQLTMLSLFWHFLDVIWIFIFSIVYMLGLI